MWFCSKQDHVFVTTSQYDNFIPLNKILIKRNIFLKYVSCYQPSLFCVLIQVMVSDYQLCAGSTEVNTSVCRVRGHQPIMNGSWVIRVLKI